MLFSYRALVGIGTLNSAKASFLATDTSDALLLIQVT